MRDSSPSITTARGALGGVRATLWSHARIGRAAPCRGGLSGRTREGAANALPSLSFFNGFAFKKRFFSLRDPQKSVVIKPQPLSPDVGERQAEGEGPGSFLPPPPWFCCEMENLTIFFTLRKFFFFFSYFRVSSCNNSHAHPLLNRTEDPAFLFYLFCRPSSLPLNQAPQPATQKRFLPHAARSCASAFAIQYVYVYRGVP